MEGGWHEVPQTRSGGVLIRKKIKTAMFSLARHRANIYLHCLNFLSAMIFSQIRLQLVKQDLSFIRNNPRFVGSWEGQAGSHGCWTAPSRCLERLPLSLGQPWPLGLAEAGRACPISTY